MESINIEDLFDKTFTYCDQLEFPQIPIPCIIIESILFSQIPSGSMKRNKFKSELKSLLEDIYFYEKETYRFSVKSLPIHFPFCPREIIEKISSKNKTGIVSLNCYTEIKYRMDVNTPENIKNAKESLIKKLDNYNDLISNQTNLHSLYQIQNCLKKIDDELFNKRLKIKVNIDGRSSFLVTIDNKSNIVYGEDDIYMPIGHYLPLDIRSAIHYSFRGAKNITFDWHNLENKIIPTLNIPKYLDKSFMPLEFIDSDDLVERYKLGKNSSLEELGMNAMFTMELDGRMKTYIACPHTIYKMEVSHFPTLMT